jgi:hypothetical protein
VDQAEALFDPFGESFDIGARKMHGSRQMFHGNENRFGYTRWYSYVMYVEAHFGPFGDNVDLGAR